MHSRSSMSEALKKCYFSSASLTEFLRRIGVTSRVSSGALRSTFFPGHRRNGELLLVWFDFPKCTSSRATHCETGKNWSCPERWKCGPGVQWVCRDSSPNFFFGWKLILVKSGTESCWTLLTSEEIRVENTDALQTTLVEMIQHRCSLMCSVRT